MPLEAPSVSFDEQLLTRDSPTGQYEEYDEERLLLTTTVEAHAHAESTVGVLMIPSPPALRRFGSFGRDHKQRKREAAFENDEVEQNSASVWNVALNLLNCILGSGLLGLPLAMAQMGAGVTVFMVLLVALMSSFSMNILVLSGRAIGQFRFALLARDRLGNFGFFVVSFFVFVSCLGCMLPYLSKFFVNFKPEMLKCL
jgi:hypothetical protein